MRKICFALLIICCALSACSKNPGDSVGSGMRKHSAEYADLFDTSAEFTAFTATDDDFAEYSRAFQTEVSELTKLFDIYNEYPGVNNLYTVNKNAGVAPVEVDARIIDMLSFSVEAYEKTDGAVNVALGPVLKIWHDFREEGMADPEAARLPELEDLKEAKKLCDINNVIIDREKSTVFLAKPGMSLDVGAVAKGYATKVAAVKLKEMGCGSFVINMGGNVYVGGKPAEKTRQYWGVGVQDPGFGSGNIFDTIYLNDKAIITSGNYQRYYTVNGKNYCHIIDPETLFPSETFAGVTIICEDAAVGDMLSTALFIVQKDKGEKLLAEFGADALWIDDNGGISYTDGYKAVSSNLSGFTNNGAPKQR